MHPAVTAAPTVDAPRAVPPFARAPVLLIAALTGLFHLVASIVDGGWFFDEMLVVSVGRGHLDWGGADQPPFAPALAALANAVAPGSIAVTRLPVVLATAAAVVVAALIARELGGDRRAQAITAAAQATTLWASVTGHWLTPYSLEPVQWLLLCWLLVRWHRTRDDRLLLVLGAVAGIAVLTKFQVGMLIVALLIGVAACGPRELLRRPALWAAAGIGLLIAAPTLVWQAVHGWPQLRMASVVAAEGEILYGGRPGIAVALILCAGVTGTVLGLYGVGRLLRGREYRYLGVAAVLLYVVFVVTEARFYYLGGLYGVLAAAGAVGLQERRERRRADGRRPRRAWPWQVLGAAVALAALYASIPMTDPAPTLAFAERTAAVYQRLPEAQREHTAVVGESYIYASYLDGYADRFALPPVYSGNRSYGYFPPPSDDRDTVIYLGTNPSALAPWFSDVRRVDGDDLWLATGRRASWTEIWPSLRTLTVS